MKHFLIEITYTAPLERIDALLADHRAFLQHGYDTQMLLCSGPMTPRTGGIIIGRADSLEAIVEFFAGDPYHLNGAATHRFVEFSPVKHQAFLQAWL
jgi:uncharacterized protein YciI